MVSDRRWRHAHPECVCGSHHWDLVLHTDLIIISVNRTFASAAPSNLAVQIEEQFGMGDEVFTLTVSLFIAGYCIGECNSQSLSILKLLMQNAGPLLWGPLSEQVITRT